MGGIGSVLPVYVMQQHRRDKSCGEYPQMFILFEGLGRGDGVIGACGRLKKSNAASLHSNANGETYVLSLADGESTTVSNQASYLCSKLEYLMAVFSAHTYIALQCTEH
ncbi:hypothetical protein EON65_27055 [archaeon]|nr:MAG: hypothetical protein EON65_27055 [archaeon]